MSRFVNPKPKNDILGLANASFLSTSLSSVYITFGRIQFQDPIRSLGSTHHSSSESSSESKWSVPVSLEFEQLHHMHLHAPVQLSPCFLQEHLLSAHSWHLQLMHSMTAVGAGETSSHLMATSESVTTHPWPWGEGTSRHLSKHIPIWQSDSWPVSGGSGLHSDRVVAYRGQSSVCQTFCTSRH